MDEGMLSGRLKRIGTAAAWQFECHRAAVARCSERFRDFRIAFGRAESHYDVFRLKNRIEPGTKEKRKIERGQGTLADDDRMDELYRDVLGVGCVRASSKRQQAAAFEETV